MVTEDGFSVAQVAEKFGVHKATIYRMLVKTQHVRS
ncbi:helix-turn-helix domain-containing protein (plasmid) [Komagataeibacter oboediens]|nr:helix-turn-helix domain-containing protein [Komagataeibacter oboediens]WEQ50910.1 helix-turn-helix domain-containing protein [Komagataeibacter oboediens]